LKKIFETFGYFLGDVISKVGLGLLAKVIGPWAPTARWKN